MGVTLGSVQAGTSACRQRASLTAQATGRVSARPVNPAPLTMKKSPGCQAGVRLLRGFAPKPISLR